MSEKILLNRLREAVNRAEQELLPELLLECRRLFKDKDASQEEIDGFLALVEGLSPKMIGAVGYELARLGLSVGRSGLHGIGGAKIPMPFEFLSFAGGFSYGGIAFKIHRECFQNETPRLFFEADTYPCDRDEVEKMGPVIRDASSQIYDVTVEIEESKAHTTRVEFSLKKPSIPWGSIRLQDGWVPCSVIRAPVIQLPYIGEYNCCFGEVTEEGDVILHRDDFCMV